MGIKETCHTAEGRVSLLTAKSDLLLIESKIVMLRRSDHSIVLRQYSCRIRVFPFLALALRYLSLNTLRYWFLDCISILSI